MADHALTPMQIATLSTQRSFLHLTNVIGWAGDATHDCWTVTILARSGSEHGEREPDIESRAAQRAGICPDLAIVGFDYGP